MYHLLPVITIPKKKKSSSRNGRQRIIQVIEDTCVKLYLQLILTASIFSILFFGNGEFLIPFLYSAAFLYISELKFVECGNQNRRFFAQEQFSIWAAHDISAML